MNIKNADELGKAVRQRRKQLEVTQKELAMTSGTGHRFIVDLEKGKPTCQVGKIFQVLQSLGLWIRIDNSKGEGSGGDPS
jgi:y4mF family transcriptional regulator